MSRAPSPKPERPPASPRLRVSGKRLRVRSLVLLAALLGLSYYYGAFARLGAALGRPGAATKGDYGAPDVPSPRPRAPSIGEPEAVRESDWLSFLKTGKVPDSAKNRLKPPPERPWSIIKVEALRAHSEAREKGTLVAGGSGRKWWNPLTWFGKASTGLREPAPEDDFALIDSGWTSSHLHPFPDSDALSDIDVDRDLADASPADDDPDATAPSWLDWRQLDEAMAEEEAQAPIVGAKRPDTSTPAGMKKLQETAKWRKLKNSDEGRLAALTGLIPPDPEKALSELGKNDFKELGRRMREFFALRRRHAEVYVHLRERHGITDPWAWRPNHPSSPMPEFPPPSRLTGPLPDDPNRITSQNHPGRKEPYAHPELTPRALDYARWFLKAYEKFLFPYLEPTFPSISALHRNSRTGGRGIIMSSGDPQLRACMVSIRTIRERMGSRLPIEIWYSGSGDLSDWGASRFKRWGDVTVRDIRYLFDHRIADLGGWHIKPFAVLGSAFREIIFVDADVYFMQPPDNLFYHPLYLETGALFFRDRHNLFPDSRGHGEWLRSVMPNPPSDTLRGHRMFQGKGQHDLESGVMVIDRWRHMEGLLAASKLISKEWREGANKWALGDKELFWFG